MARLKIKDAPLLPVINGDEKIPTGGKGDFTLTPNMLAEHFKSNSGFATDAELNVVDGKVNNHVNNEGNPHKVTKEQVGLGQVNNTSDIDKPVSNATSIALDTKADKIYVDQLIINANNGITNYQTQAQLLAFVPTTANYTAKALDTKKVWLWDGVQWNDTGLSELDLANRNAEHMTHILDKQTVKKFSGNDGDLLIALTDALGNRTWLEANNENGGLTTLAVDHIFNAFNTQFRTINSDDYFYSLTDRLGFATDLTLDNTGQLAEFVVQRLAERLTEYISIPEFEDIKQKPISTLLYPIRNKISIWGSSSVAGYHSAFSGMSAELGYTDIYLGGKGSERMEQTCARLGSHPAPCTVTGGVIPASGSIVVGVDWRGTSSEGLKTYTGTLNGVHGSLSYLTKTTCNFTRTSSGTAVSTVGTFPFIPDANSYRDGVIVLNIAKNNLSTVQEGFGDPYDAFKWTKEAFNYAKAHYKWVIILGHFVNTDTTEGARNQTLTYNQLCEEYFEDRYVDLQNYLTGQQVWIDAEITPTSDDLAQQARGEKPMSLSNDTMHLNVMGSQLVVNKIKERLIQLNWSNN